MNGSNGIMLETCNGSIIRDNILSADSTGIWLYHSDNNTVSDNFASGGYYGILLCGHSSENIVIRNTMKDNVVGIALTGWDNLIYHNNFVNNQNQTKMIESHNNTWDNDFDGNYWSNYNGTDTNQDGIGDTPYLIDVNNQDNYPLMGMFSQFQVSKNGETYYVTTISNSTITSLDFAHSMSLDVTGPQGTTGFCRTILPRTLFNDNETILVNGLPPITEKELPASNNTYAYLYLAYLNTTTALTITPTTLVIIVSVLVIATVAAIIVVRNVRSKKKSHARTI
jgi:parallel beta-helix repeat protein